MQIYWSFDDVPFEVVRGDPLIVHVAGYYSVAGTAYGWAISTSGNIARRKTLKAARKILAEAEAHLEQHSPMPSFNYFDEVPDDVVEGELQVIRIPPNYAIVGKSVWGLAKASWAKGKNGLPWTTTKLEVARAAVARARRLAC